MFDIGVSLCSLTSEHYFSSMTQRYDKKTFMERTLTKEDTCE